MQDDQHERRGAVFTELIFDLFRVNGLLLSQGDRLVAGLGLTSARWQVLGAVAFAASPQPVAWLARDLGGNRQNIQRIVNDLEADGFVEFRLNPHHRRAQLVAMTEKGGNAYARATELWRPWADSLAEGRSQDALDATATTMRALRRKLESAGDD